MLGATVPGGEPRLVDDLGMADEPQHSLGHRVGARRDCHPMVVSGAIEVSRSVVDRAVPGPLPDHSRLVDDGRTRPGCGHHPLENRKIDDLAFAAPRIAVVERDRNESGGRDPTDAVRKPERGQGGGPIRVSGEMGETAHCLSQRPESGPVRIRAELAPPRDPGEDQTRVPGLELLPADAPALQCPGPEVLHDDVGASCHLQEHVRPFRVAEIQPDVMLVARDLAPPDGHSLARRPVSPHSVSALGMLELDDVSSVVTEDLTRQGSGEDRRHVEHRDARQRSPGCSAAHPTLTGSAARRSGRSTYRPLGSPTGEPSS